MIVVPLGLGARLAGVPVVTILVAVAWVTFAWVDPGPRVVAPALLKAAVKTGVVRETRRLFEDYCTARSGGAQGCRILARRLTTPPKGLERASWPLGLWAVGLGPMRAYAEACRGESSCRELGEVMLDFRERLEKRPQSFRTFQSYGAYRQATARYEAEVKRLCRTENCLVPGNVTPESLLFAQLRHDGYVHLLANILLLLIFGAYVEQRGSRLVYAMALLAGGTFGLAIHTALVANGIAPVVGGSGNVAAALGMFCVLFWRQRMRLVVFVGTGLKTFHARVLVCIPLFYLLAEAVGAVAEATGNGLGVAHVAHLAGFAVGGALALGMSKLPRPFLYDAEVEAFRALRREPDLMRVIEGAARLLEHNPDNYKVMEWASWRILRWIRSVELGSRTALYSQAREFLRRHLAPMAAMRCKQGDHHRVCSIIGKMPLYMPFGTYLERLGQENVLALGDYALTRGDHWLALRFYDHYLTRYRHTRKSYDVYRTSLSVLSSLEFTTINARFLRAYLFFHRTTPLAVAIHEWLTGHPPHPIDEALDHVS